jgi:hypothetical protein
MVRPSSQKAVILAQIVRTGSLNRTPMVGNDNSCNGIPNEGCVCVGAQTEACGYCGSGTATCVGGAAPSMYGPCAGESGCAPSSTQSCTPSYPYGCTGSQTCDPNTCTWDGCANSCSPFTPNPNMPGVAAAAFNIYQAGPNSLSGSVTKAGPWQVCPNGSHIETISCQTEPGSIGTCVQTYVSTTGAGIEVDSPQNCCAETQGYLVVTCIAN